MNLKARLGDEVYDLEVRRGADGGYRVRLGDAEFRVDLEEPEPNLYSMLVEEASYEVLVRPNGDLVDVDLAGRRYEVRVQDPLAARGAGGRPSVAGTQVIRSVMAGKILDVMVAEGARVSQGDPLVIIEAMKMENEIRSPKDGTVTSVRVRAGQAVERGAELAIVE